MSLRRTLKMFQNIKNWDAYLKYKLTGKKNETFTFRLRNDFSVIVHRQIMPEFKESLFEEVYFKHLPKTIFKTKNPTILDIGANVGFFSILSLLKFDNPHIISFEPIVRNFAELQKNITNIDKNNLTIVNKAVSNIKGEIILKFDKNQSITTSASIFDNQYGSDEEKVFSTTLENIFNDYKLTKVDILKLDCEGAEYGIFYNTPPSVFKNVYCITLETHQGKENNENNAALSDYLGKLGFKLKVSPNEFIWAYKK